MFKVYKVRLREDEDAEKNDLRNTIGFDNAVRVKSFNVWHGRPHIYVIFWFSIACLHATIDPRVLI